MKISIIHPSRDRVKQAIQTRDKWLDNADSISNIEYILSTDISDANFAHYRNEFLLCKHTINNNRSAIDAINNAAKIATGDIFIQIADDFDCPMHWDKLLIDAIAGRTDFVAKTDDGLQPWIITLPIMDRVYYNRFGYIYYPEYKHLFPDLELTHVGALTGRLITLPISFLHNHYSTGNTPKDAINVKNDATWNQGEDLYLDRVKINFGLENILPVSLPHSHLSWLKSKNIFL